MGFEVTRFVGEVDEELLCTICGQVLQDPIQIHQCEHCFCSECIDEWLKHQQICPVDRNPVSLVEDLIPAPRILRNLLSRLKITCDNKEFGCTVIVKLDSLSSHMDECQYNPKRPVACDKGCGMVVPLDEVPQHSCIQELHKMIKVEKNKVTDLTSRLHHIELVQQQQEGELAMLKGLVHGLRTSAGLPASMGYPDEVERGIHTARWLATLRPARVRRWGGMISTPDAVLQSIIRRALSDSGCPSYLMDELMANAHERRWPPGLSTLETRQINRRRYEQYVTKRVPSKQAIIVMSSENEHMGESMIISPGMVMIFAHGVE